MAERNPNLKDDEHQADWRYEVKPRGYVRGEQEARGVGPGPRRSVVRIANADRRIAEAKPDGITPNFSGRYQNAAAVGMVDGQAILLHVNHVGKHLEGMFVFVPTHGALRMHRFAGEHTGDHFWLHDLGTDTGEGKLRNQAGVLTVEYSEPAIAAGTHFFIRERRASFLDEAFDPLLESMEIVGNSRPDADAVRANELVPLTDVQMRRVQEAVALEHIKPFLDEYHEWASAPTTADRAKAIYAIDEWQWMGAPRDGLDRYIGRELGPTRWPAPQIPEVLEYARAILGTQRVTIGGVTKSTLQHIESDASAVINTPGPVHRDLANLRRLLGWGPPGGITQAITYEIELKLKYKGAGLGTLELKKLPVIQVQVGGYSGTMAVRRTTSPSWRDRVTYKVVVLGGGALVGKGGKKDLNAKGTVEAHAEWTEADFLGQVVLFDGAAWAGKEKWKVKGIELKYKLGVEGRDVAFIVRGSKNYPELLMPLKSDETFREGMGAEIAVSLGYSFRFDDELRQRDYTRAPTKISYTIPKEALDEVHFDFGSAILRAWGRHRVRQFCGRWLAWLQAKESKLVIVGHADTVDRPDRNRDLSMMRAKNTLQAIRDTIGDDFGIPDENVTLMGFGENEAQRHDPDNTRDLAFRRVDVYLNGHCALSLVRA